MVKTLRISMDYPQSNFIIMSKVLNNNEGDSETIMDGLERVPSS